MISAGDMVILWLCPGKTNREKKSAFRFTIEKNMFESGGGKMSPEEGKTFPEVGIVLLNYNQKERTRQCLRSLSGQNYLVTRKISYGSQSERGMKTREILTSVLHTAAARSLEPAAFLEAFLNDSRNASRLFS